MGCLKKKGGGDEKLYMVISICKEVECITNDINSLNKTKKKKITIAK